MSLQSNLYTSIGDNTGSPGGVYIALGSNTAFENENGFLIEGAGLFRSVLHALKRAGVTTLRVSSLWSSPAWPDPTLEEYKNVVAEVAPTELNAQAFMSQLLELETQFGRVRTERWASRTLDIDLIDFRGEVIVGHGEGELVCPHLRAHERSFVMGPLREIAPDWRHPVLGGHVKDYEKSAMKAWPAYQGDAFLLEV